VSHLLFVVARTDFERYEWLTSIFAHDATVEVIVDRRQRERRQGGIPPQGERRRRDRRVRDISYELNRLGYALVRRPSAVNRVSSQSWVNDSDPRRQERPLCLDQ
jgi:hypothetical protein